MNRYTKYQTLPLADVMTAIPLLTRWFIEEWEPYYGPDGPGDAEKDLLESCNRGDLPIALVALENDGTILGTAAIKKESVGSETGLGPWLAALYVPIEHRKRGVGTALVESIENKARSLGFETLFVSTDAAENIVRQRGWIKLENSAESLRGPVAVYQANLKN